jgi:glyoxylase-like metal-dependent hydrolase (beta-lactamase superfamily II)
MGRVYLIEDPDGLTLIDTGMGPVAGRILSQAN